MEQLGGGGDTEGYIEFVNENGEIVWHTTGQGGFQRKSIGHSALSNGSILGYQRISYELESPDWYYSKIRVYNLNLQTGNLEILNEIFDSQEILQGGAGDLIEEDDGYVFLVQEHKKTGNAYHLISSIFKLNLDYELEWYTELAYDPCVTCTNQIWDMEKAPDGGYVMVGRFRDTATDPYDNTWLVKVDACGDLEFNRCWPVGLSEFENQDLKFEIYPNPVQDVLHVSYPEVSALPRGLEGYILEISNSLGQIVYSENARPDQLSNYPINLSTFPSGLYTLYLKSKGQVLASEKFVKE